MTMWSRGTVTPTDKDLAQNIYDTPDFFEGYSRLDRSVRGLDGGPEWPALRGLLPDLRGKRLLDLGCGIRLDRPIGGDPGRGERARRRSLRKYAGESEGGRPPTRVYRLS